LAVLAHGVLDNGSAGTGLYKVEDITVDKALSLLDSVKMKQNLFQTTLLLHT